MDLKKFQIRNATNKDTLDVLSVEKAAFGSNIEAKLVADLLTDESALPIISLLAFDGDSAIGHILFTRAYINDVHHKTIIHILAPLAVIPEYQNQGIGGELINSGLEMLRENGTDLVFVLGYPDYYSKHGFIPDANSLGYASPFPILDKNKDPWMVQSLAPNVLDYTKGNIICADAMNKIEYWTE